MYYGLPPLLVDPVFLVQLCGSLLRSGLLRLQQANRTWIVFGPWDMFSLLYLNLLSQPKSVLLKNLERSIMFRDFSLPFDICLFFLLIFANAILLTFDLFFKKAIPPIQDPESPAFCKLEQLPYEVSKDLCFMLCPCSDPSRVLWKKFCRGRQNYGGSMLIKNGLWNGSMGFSEIKKSTLYLQAQSYKTGIKNI